MRMNLFLNKKSKHHKMTRWLFKWLAEQSNVWNVLIVCMSSTLSILDLEYVKVIDCLITSCRIEEPNNLVLISADSWERVKMHHKFCMWGFSLCWQYVYADYMCRSTVCPFWIWYSFVESGAMNVSLSLPLVFRLKTINSSAKSECLLLLSKHYLRFV